MRWLLAAVIGMGVLIVAGTIFLAGTMITRLSAPPAHGIDAVLDEPAGTAVTATSLAGDRLALALHGGGADRVVVVDLRSGKVLGRVAVTK